MRPIIGLTFSLGILCARPRGSFENNGLYLTIKQIYDIIPKNQRSRSDFIQFRSDFFLKGTSNEINNILWPKITPAHQLIYP